MTDSLAFSCVISNMALFFFGGWLVTIKSNAEKRVFAAIMNIIHPIVWCLLLKSYWPIIFLIIQILAVVLFSAFIFMLIDEDELNG